MCHSFLKFATIQLQWGGSSQNHWFLGMFVLRNVTGTAVPPSPGWPWWWKWEIQLHYETDTFHCTSRVTLRFGNSQMHRTSGQRVVPGHPSPKAALPQLWVHHLTMGRMRRKVQREGTLPTGSAPSLQSLFCAKWQQNPLSAAGCGTTSSCESFMGNTWHPSRLCKAGLSSVCLNPVNGSQLVQTETWTPRDSAAISDSGRTRCFLRHRKGLQENKGVTHFGEKRLVFTCKVVAHRIQSQALPKEF